MNKINYFPDKKKQIKDDLKQELKIFRTGAKISKENEKYKETYIYIEQTRREVESQKRRDASRGEQRQRETMGRYRR